MDSKKYSRTVTLLCPTCGSDQFSHDGEEGPTQVLTCARCSLKMTRESLIGSNSENVNLHAKEIGKEVVSDLKKELAKAFQGNRFIKLK